MTLGMIVAWFCATFCLIGLPIGFGIIVRPKLTMAVSLTVLIVLGLALAVQIESGHASFKTGQNIAAGLGGFSGSLLGQYVGLEYESGPRW